MIQSRQMRRITALIVCLSAILGGTCLALTWWASRAFPAPVDDVGQYQAILTDWQGVSLVDHFPTSIPTEAREVWLHYQPCMLQAGSKFHVGMTLPAAEVRSLQARLRTQAPHSVESDEESKLAAAETRHLFAAVESPPVGLQENLEFASWPEVYVLGAVDFGSGWNHGETCGVAISPESDQVVFWVNTW